MNEDNCFFKPFDIIQLLVILIPIFFFIAFAYVCESNYIEVDL